MLRVCIPLLLTAAPLLYADQFTITFQPTIDRDITGGEPRDIGLRATFHTDGACSVCTIVDFYNLHEYLVIDGLIDITFETARGDWLGVGPSGFYGAPFGDAHVTYDAAQHLLYGSVAGAGPDAINLSAQGKYALLFAGVQQQSGLFTINPAPSSQVPEPSTGLLLLPILVFIFGPRHFWSGRPSSACR